MALTSDEKHVWKEWEVWDAKRYEHQWDVYGKKQNSKGTAKKAGKSAGTPGAEEALGPSSSIPKKNSSAFHIPKKRK